MEVTPTNTKITHSDKPRSYKVTIHDNETGEVVQEYDTKVAIIFGLQDDHGDEPTEKLNINSIHIGSAKQVSQLLGIVNNTVVAYLNAMWEQTKKLMEKGAKAD